MTEIGAKLKEARESKGLSLREIHEITKIQPKYLTALEQENFEMFSGNVYIKGALRNYATVIDLDPAEILEVYSEIYEKDTTISQEHITSSNTKSKKEILFPPNGLNKRKVIVLLLLTAFIVWLIYHTAGRVDLNFLTDSDIEQTQANNNGTDADTPVEIEDPPPEENVFEQVEQTVEVVLVHEDAGNQVFNVKNAEMISLEIKFSTDCWVRIKENDISILETTFLEGETHSLESDKELTIRIGYPPGVSAIIVNSISLLVREEARAYDIKLILVLEP